MRSSQSPMQLEISAGQLTESDTLRRHAAMNLPTTGRAMTDLERSTRNAIIRDARMADVQEN